MQKTFYLSTLGWEELPATLIYPINATYGVDGGVDTTQFSFYAPQDFDLPLDTPIKVQHDDDIRYFVVKDTNYSDMLYKNLKTQQAERLYTIVLVEPMELLKGYKLQACKFAPNRYTIKSCIRRLFNLANFTGNINIANGDNAIENVIEFASTNLYLALYEIARIDDCVPYLTFENDNYLRWVLKFQKLDGLNEQVFDGSIFKNPIIQQQSIGEGIAKRVYIEANNIRNNKTKKYNEVSIIATNGSDTVNINNLGLRLNNKIDELISLEVDTEDNYKWYFSNDVTLDYVVALGDTDDYEGRFISQASITVKILSKTNYDLLLTSEKESYDYIYIYYEDNIIYLHDLFKLKPNSISFPDGVWEDNKFYIGKNYTLPNRDIVGLIHSYNKPIWNQSFNVYAQTTVNYNIPFVAFNENSYDDFTYYNQNAKAVDPVAMERVLQTYINNMQSSTLIRTGTFNKYTDIPLEGSIININDNKYIVNSLTITDNSRYYDVTFSLVKHHAKRREYLEANTDIQIEDITSNDLIPSHNINAYVITYSMDIPIETKDVSNIVSHQGIVMPKKDNYLYNANMDLTFNYSGTSLGNFFQQDSEYIAFSNSISFYSKAENNFIWKDIVDVNGNLIPQAYADENGEVIRAKINLNSQDGTELINVVLAGNNTSPLKDKYEIFTHTLQLTYKGVNDTLVGKDFIKWLLNANDFKRVEVFTYNQHISNFDSRPENYVSRQEYYIVYSRNLQCIQLFMDNQSVLVGEYKSLVVTDVGGQNILFIKNLYEYADAITDYIPIYYSIEDGLPLQTGVRPYDYKN